MTDLVILPLDVAYTWDLWAARYEANLVVIPPLLEHMRKAVYSVSAAPIREKLSGGGYKAGVPFHGGDDEQLLVDQADDLWAQLVIYARDVADRLDTPDRPAALSSTWEGRNDTHGLRASADARTVRLQAYDVTEWLIVHLEQTGSLEDPANALREAEAGLYDAVRRYGGRWGFRPVQRWVQPPLCTVCGERAIAIDWTTDDAGITTGLGVCQHCQQTYATAAA